jgi:hypothetical protein
MTMQDLTQPQPLLVPPFLSSRAHFRIYS